MYQEIYGHIDRIQERHWWFRGRRYLLEKLITKYLAGLPVDKALDIGTATGYNLKLLQRYARQTFTVDPSDLAEALVRKNSPESVFIKAAFPNVELPHQFEIITSLDSLEHIENDHGSIAKVENLLAPGGIAILMVPAYPFLWSEQDRVLEHHRRYLKRRLIRLIQANSNLKIEYVSYFNSALFLPITAYRLFRKVVNIFPGKSDDIIFKSTFFDRLMYPLFKTELTVLPRLKYPFGISLVAVLRK